MHGYLLTVASTRRASLHSDRVISDCRFSCVVLCCVVLCCVVLCCVVLCCVVLCCVVLCCVVPSLYRKSRCTTKAHTTS